MPVLNEAAGIANNLMLLAPLRQRGTELIVVDGGSTDDTVAIAKPLSDTVISAPRGRASQMNAGAALAQSPILLFLHADTTLPVGGDYHIYNALNNARKWGRFDVRITGNHPLLRVVERMINLRSRLSGIATGDQALFVCRQTFDAVGGFPDIPLMEDVAFSKILKRHSPPVCLKARVITDGRRWQKQGTLRTILLMWRLRLAYALGADPWQLARQYGYTPREHKMPVEHQNG